MRKNDNDPKQDSLLPMAAVFALHKVDLMIYRQPWRATGKRFTQPTTVFCNMQNFHWHSFTRAPHRTITANHTDSVHRFLQHDRIYYEIPHIKRSLIYNLLSHTVCCSPIPAVACPKMWSQYEWHSDSVTRLDVPSIVNLSCGLIHPSLATIFLFLSLGVRFISTLMTIFVIIFRRDSPIFNGSPGNRALLCMWPCEMCTIPRTE